MALSEAFDGAVKVEKTCVNCGTSGCDYRDTRRCASSTSRVYWTPEQKETESEQVPQEGE